jgi:hypothetical protein
MTERNGVRRGQRVRDADGKDLGRVKRLYPLGFEVRKGLPLLFRADAVIRYDEVRGVRDGVLVVARSDRDVLDLAAGGVPRTWRVPAPPGFPSAATPSEARLVLDDIAAGSAFSPQSLDEPLASAAPVAPPPVPFERTYSATRGQASPPAPRPALGAEPEPRAR